MDAAALIFAHIYTICPSLHHAEIFRGIPQSAGVQIWLQLAILALLASWSAWLEIGLELLM